MSFTATLDLNGKKYRILHVEYDFTQPTNHERQPTAKPVSGFINLVIESTKDSEPIEWMLQHSMVKNGKIVFNRRDVASEMRRIEFKDAYCVFYREVFDFNSESPMVIHLRLSPREMKIDNHAISQSWTVGGGGGAGGGADAGTSASAQQQSSPSPAGSSSGVSSFVAD